jgi:hypothetical protein
MVGMKIEELKLEARPAPNWRSGRPPSLVMVASTGAANLVLDHIGPECEFLIEGEPLDEWFRGVNLEPGVWVVEVSIVSTPAGYGDALYGDEYDMDMNVGEVRMATAEELDHHSGGEWPWDPELWMDNWDEVRSWQRDVLCIGDGGEEGGCGRTGGVSGYTCPDCNGMLLSPQSIREAERLGKTWRDTQEAKEKA